MTDTVLAQIQVRGDTAANLATVVPKLREPVYETDTGLLKVGDGVTVTAAIPTVASAAKASATAAASSAAAAAAAAAQATAPTDTSVASNIQTAGTATQAALDARSDARYARLDSWVESRVSTADAAPRPEDIPTVTWSTSDTTALTSPVILKPAVCGIGSQTTGWDGASDTVFRYEPGTFQTSAGGNADYALYGETKPGGASQAARWPLAISFVTQATNNVVEVAYYSLVTSAFIRVEVNGRMVTATEMVQPASNGGKFTLTFPTAAARTIRIWATGEIGFALFRVPTGQTLMKPPAPKRLVAMLGDSYLNGAGSNLVPSLGTVNLTTYGLHLARYLGGDSVMLAGIGGTGINAGATASPVSNYASRAAIINARSPQVLVINASINDGTAAGTLQASTTALLQQFSSIPEVYVIGGIKASYEPMYAAVKAATVAAGRTYLDVGTLLFGTGNIGNPKGDGTFDYWLIEDNAHPTIDAHLALARIAFKMYAQTKLGA